MKLRDFNSGEAQKFNNNIRCIEIFFINIDFLIQGVFNNNIRCIEMFQKTAHPFQRVTFNNNIRCIEIDYSKQPNDVNDGLITT